MNLLSDFKMNEDDSSDDEKIKRYNGLSIEEKIKKHEKYSGGTMTRNIMQQE